MLAQEWFEYHRQTKHKQLEQIKNALSHHDGEDIVNIDEINVTSELLKDDDLEYSNDTVIDLICKVAKKTSKDQKCKNILDKTRIAVDELYSPVTTGKALQVCPDDSYRISVGGQIYQALEIISDYIGSVCMFEYGDCASPQVLKAIIYYNIQRIKKQKQDTTYIDNTDKDIGVLLMYRMSEDDVQKYIRYTSEVFEVGLAFLIGHELGHHYNEDTQPGKECESKPRSKAKIEDGFIPFTHSLVSAKQERELKADEYAYCFANDYVTTMYGTHKLHHAHALYAMFLASSLIGDPELITNKHPSIAMRYMYLNLLNFGAFTPEIGLYIADKQIRSRF